MGSIGRTTGFRGLGGRLGGGPAIDRGLLLRMNRRFLTRMWPLCFDEVVSVRSNGCDCSIDVPHFGGGVLHCDMVDDLKV